MRAADYLKEKRARKPRREFQQNKIDLEEFFMRSRALPRREAQVAAAHYIAFVVSHPNASHDERVLAYREAGDTGMAIANARDSARIEALERVLAEKA